MRTAPHRPLRIAALAAAATLAASLVAAPSLRAATRPPAPASVAPATTVQAAQAEVLATQDLIDAASATLAQVRNELFIAADPGTIASLDLQQSRLQVRKTVLIAHLAIQQRRLNQLIAQQASLEARNASLALNASTAPPVLQALSAASLPAPGPTAATIDRFLQGQVSPLTGLGAVFVADAESVGVDPRVLVAISGAETSFATYGPAQADPQSVRPRAEPALSELERGDRRGRRHPGRQPVPRRGARHDPGDPVALGPHGSRQRPPQPEQQLGRQRLALLRRPRRTTPTAP